MIKRVIVGALVALTLVGAGVAIGASADGDWGWNREAVVISDGSGATDAGQTIVVTDGHGFPFGLLFFALVLLFVFSAFRRGRRGGPWRNRSGGPARLEDWHRRAHADDATDASRTGSA